LNTVKGRVPLPDKIKKKIKCKKLNCLACPKKSLLKSKAKRRKVVTQLGGTFWTLLIPAVLSLLAQYKSSS